MLLETVSKSSSCFLHLLFNTFLKINYLVLKHFSLFSYLKFFKLSGSGDERHGASVILGHWGRPRRYYCSIASYNQPHFNTRNICIMWGSLLQNSRIFWVVFGSGTCKPQVNHVAGSSASENVTPTYLRPEEL